MKYFRDVATGTVYAYEEDGSQDEWILPGLVPMTAEEVAVHLNPPLTPEQQYELAAVGETTWRTGELQVIANQLLALEEQEAGVEDSGAFPGTRLDWLRYRTRVREWVEGNQNFPDDTKRPVRPA